jgi:hypothetical protein
MDFENSDELVDIYIYITSGIYGTNAVLGDKMITLASVDKRKLSSE